MPDAAPRLPDADIGLFRERSIALHFAVRDNPPENDKPGALFVLNCYKLNDRTAGGPTELHAGDFPCWLRSQQSEDPTLKSLSVEIATSRPGDLPQFTDWLVHDRDKWAKYFSRPVAAWPRAIHERMIRQQSVFVVFGGTHAMKGGDIPEPCLLEDLDRELPSVWQFLRKFQIPAKHKPSIRRDLEAIGVHVASLFPEMEYQAAFIRNAHKATVTAESRPGAQLPAQRYATRTRLAARPFAATRGGGEERHGKSSFVAQPLMAKFRERYVP